jgi:hypothetical protein
MSKDKPQQSGKFGQIVNRMMPVSEGRGMPVNALRPVQVAPVAAKPAASVNLPQVKPKG